MAFSRASKLHVWDRMQILVEHVSSDMLRLRRSPARIHRKVVRKDQLHYWRTLQNWVVYLKIRIRESLFNVQKEKWDQNTPSNSSRAPGTKKKKGQKGVHRKEVKKVWTSWAWSLRANFRERSHEETVHQERCARWVAWDLAKLLQTQECRQNYVLILLLKPKWCQHILQNLQKSENSQ